MRMVPPPLDHDVECWVLPTAQPAQSSRLYLGLGGEIRRRRHAVGYSQETLAEIVGIDRTQIGVLERGDNTISVQTLRLIAVALGAKLSDIFEDAGF
jgi:DNA-binding XRE family transcriptional regulator